MLLISVNLYRTGGSPTGDTDTFRDGIWRKHLLSLSQAACDRFQPSSPRQYEGAFVRDAIRGHIDGPVVAASEQSTGWKLHDIVGLLDADARIDLAIAKRAPFRLRRNRHWLYPHGFD